MGELEGLTKPELIELVLRSGTRKDLEDIFEVSFDLPEMPEVRRRAVQGGPALGPRLRSCRHTSDPSGDDAGPSAQRGMPVQRGHLHGASTSADGVGFTVRSWHPGPGDASYASDSSRIAGGGTALRGHG